MVFEQKSLTEDKMLGTVTELLAKPERLQQMSEAALSLAQPEAASKVAAQLEAAAAGRRRP